MSADNESSRRIVSSGFDRHEKGYCVSYVLCSPSVFQSFAAKRTIDLQNDYDGMTMNETLLLACEAHLQVFKNSKNVFKV